MECAGNKIAGNITVAKECVWRREDAHFAVVVVGVWLCCASLL